MKEFPPEINIIDYDGYLAISVMRREDIAYAGLLIETTGNRDEARKAIMSVYNNATKDECPYVANIGYLEDQYRDQLKPTWNNMKMIEIFMLLSLIISIMGLVAMSTYFAGEHSKDIAIRKVFGGTVSSETKRSVSQYMIQVVVAIAIGIPLAVFAAGKYIQQFVCQLQGYWWMFFAAALLTLAIALISVFWQTLRATQTNPATDLKKE